MKAEDLIDVSTLEKRIRLAKNLIDFFDKNTARIFVMRYCACMTFPEIARAMYLTAATVKKLHHEGLKKIRRGVD